MVFYAPYCALFFFYAALLIGQPATRHFKFLKDLMGYPIDFRLARKTT